MPKKTENQKPLYFNRDLSWVEFNRRVLAEGISLSVPLLDRLKFLSITSSNFDEFFMVRIAALKRAVRHGDQVTCPSGTSPSMQLEEIDRRIRQIVQSQYSCLTKELLPTMKARGIRYLGPAEWSAEQLRFIGKLFQEQIFPVISPVRLEKDEPFPFICGLRLHIAFIIASGEGEEKTALVQVPDEENRVIFLPDTGSAKSFALLEELIIDQAEYLFPGYRIREAVIFRTTRDAGHGR